MPANSRRWIPLDQAVVDALGPVVRSPGIIFPLASDALPASLQGVTGVTSSFATAYEPHRIAPNDPRVVGEILVARHDPIRNATNNYIFVIAVDTLGNWYFKGPFYPFRHHAPVGEHTAVQSLFFSSSFPA